MKVVIVEPEKQARVEDINANLESFQSIVGGWIQVIYPFEDRVGLVCNDEGKLLNMPLNRALYDGNGNIYDIISGTFFICGLSEEDFKSLSNELATKYLNMFHTPQAFLNIGGDIIALDVEQ